MSNYVSISRERHGTKRWSPSVRYDFAKTSPVVPISIEELPRASGEIPCAFTRHEDRFVLSVLLGLQPEANLFVAPDGRWISRYTPAMFKAHPFRLARIQGRENLALVIDEDEGLTENGEPFFNEQGEPAPKLAEIIELLTKFEQGRRKTDELVKELENAGLIEEWPLTVRSLDGSEQKLGGLFRVSEQKLNQLDDETFLKLRHSQALPLAYMQLLSMRNINILGQLAKAQIDIAQKQAQQAAEFFYGDQDDELKIDWSQFETKE